MTEQELLTELLRVRSHLDWTLRVLEIIVQESAGTGEFNLSHVEQRTILDCIRACNGDKPRAAQALGISISTLHAKVAAIRKRSAIREVS